MALRVRVGVLRASEGRSLFSLGTGIRPLLELPASADGVERLAQAMPQVVVVDGRRAPGALTGTIRAARDRIPDARVVAIGDPGDDATAAAALEAGAFSFLGSEVGDVALRQAVQAAADGRLHFTRTGRRAAQRLLARAKS